MLTARDRRRYATRLQEERQRAVRILEQSVREQAADDVESDPAGAP